MFHTRLRMLLTLLVLTLALAASLLLRPTSIASASSGPDFTLSANPTSLTLIRASATDSRKNVDVQIGSVNGFTGTVHLHTDDHYPKTVTAWLDTSGNLLGLTDVDVTAPTELLLQVTANAEGSSNCSVFVPINVTATSGTLQHSFTVELRVELRGVC